MIRIRSWWENKWNNGIKSERTYLSISESEPSWRLMKKEHLNYHLIQEWNEMKCLEWSKTEKRREMLGLVREKRNVEEKNDKSERIMRAITGYTHTQRDGDDDGRRNRSQALMKDTVGQECEKRKRRKRNWIECVKERRTGKCWVDFKGVV